jgi:hypothetical protein
VHALFIKRRAINFSRDANLRMISKQLAIDYAKSKCSVYVGAAILWRETPEEVNVEKPHPTIHNQPKAVSPVHGSMSA